MKVTEHLERAAGEPLLSFEILPPLKGKGIATLFSLLDKLVKFSPSFINVTYHQPKQERVQLESGEFMHYPSRKRPGTVGVASAILNRYKIDPVPHLICRGFTPSECEDMLIDLNYLGIDNLLVILGDDPIKNYIPLEKEHHYAFQLVRQVKQMNQGTYCEKQLKEPTPTQFCVGVGGYPEKHFRASTLEKDISNLKHKLAQGADYVVTQFFFDNQKYYNFVAKCRAAGITVPIIPGIKPLSGLKQARRIEKLFHVSLPEVLIRQLSAARNETEEKKIGRQWCEAQCQDLLEKKSPGLHFYTMSKEGQVEEVMKQLAPF